MPALTINSTGERHVIGDMVFRTFNVSGASGDWVDTKVPGAVLYGVQQFTSGWVASSVTQMIPVPTPTSTILVLATAGGPIINEVVWIMGRKG